MCDHTAQNAFSLREMIVSAIAVHQEGTDVSAERNITLYLIMFKRHQRGTTFIDLGIGHASGQARRRNRKAPGTGSGAERKGT